MGSAAAALLAVGCAGPATSGPPLALPDWGDDRAQARQVAEAAAPAEVIYLGEQHDNPAHHARQRLILEALAEGGPATAVGFEMLPEGRQAAVDAALAGPPGRAALESALGWRASGWPDFAMYWPLFELARERGWPVLALDLEPAVARRIARGGLGAAGDDAPRLSSLLAPDPAREAQLAQTVVEAHCGLLPAERVPSLVAAWHARNVVMARRIAAALDGGRRVVVIAGRGHQAPGGLPAQLAALRPGTRQFVVDLVEVARGDDPADAVAHSHADAVWLTPAVDREDPCAPLRRAPPGGPPRGAPGPDVVTSGLDRRGASRLDGECT